MKSTTKLSLSFALCSLGLSASSFAATSLVSGEIRQAGSWDNGLPTATNDGTISVDGTVTANFNTGAVRFVDTTITQTAGTITGIFNTAGAEGLMWNLTGGTINSTGNAAGTGGANFNANGGAIFNLTGGELIFGSDLIVNNIAGGINVGGTAIVSTPSQFDLRLNQDNAFLSIASDWTGSFVSGADATEADWIAELVFGAGPAGSAGNAVNPLRQIDVAGTPIDDTNFSDFFLVTPDGDGGSSLTLVPEPSSGLLLGLGGLALILRRRK